MSGAGACAAGVGSAEGGVAGCRVCPGRRGLRGRLGFLHPRHTVRAECGRSSTCRLCRERGQACPHRL